MKGLLPAPCRVVGYALLLVSVFVPMLMYMFGMVDDSNLLMIKSGVRLLVGVCLFMIFLSKAKDEGEQMRHIRAKALQYALYIWGVYYVVVGVKDLVMGSVSSSEQSSSILFLVICVICLEFLGKKHRIEQQFKNRR